MTASDLASMTDNPTALPSLSPQDALIALMIGMSASDANIRTAELLKINNSINNLPIFAHYNVDNISNVSAIVFDLFEQKDGLSALFGLIRTSLPDKLYETAYALACDVSAADGRVASTEARMLEEIRHELNIDRLHAAAIERGSRARHMTV